MLGLKEWEMTPVVGNLFDRAERVGAALLICDDQDRIVRVNSRHR